jgi:hypothetical protein
MHESAGQPGDHVTAAAFAAVLLALLAAHHIGDHWVQTDTQAQGKGERSAAGARHCAAHVASYTACTALASALAWWALDLPVTPAGFVLAQVLSAVTHYWADRRFTLAWLCARLGKAGYYERGGAYQLDQSWHWLWLTVAAGAMVAV